MKFQGVPALAGMVMVCAAMAAAQAAMAQDAALVAKANTGNPAAETQLGDYYSNQSTQKGYDEAAVWYKKAAAKEYGEAEYKLGIAYCWKEGVPQDYSEGYYYIALGIGDGVVDTNHWLNFAASHMTAAEVAAAKAKAQRWLKLHPAKK